MSLIFAATGILLFLVCMAGQQATASQTCQYTVSCTPTCSYNTRTCDDICCQDKTKGYNDICCSSNSDTVVIAGSTSGGIITCIVFFVFIYWCCCRTPTRVATTVHTVVY